MRTVGVDLAAEPRKTAVAVIAWSEGGARVESLRLGVGNAEIVEAVRGAERTGIDSPFGWPEAFVRFLNEHDGDGLPVPNGLESRDGRRPLAMRRTDLLVRASTGLSPLSVSADRIAHVAFRCAGLLAELRYSGIEAGRVSGRAVEVYPAAALLGWGLPARGYKGLVNRAALTELVTGFAEAAPWLALGEGSGCAGSPTTPSMRWWLPSWPARSLSARRPCPRTRIGRRRSGRGGFTCRIRRWKRCEAPESERRKPITASDQAFWCSEVCRVTFVESERHGHRPGREARDTRLDVGARQS
ncbi:hypothetical protein BTZ20_4228 [Rhodococcus sp. MTM3W5.2]|nr:hypothetical protein BTZ20_4228 [Rhodococcus sp. MTM3W5.2]